ncbi:MAG: hypothetical protein HQ518_25995 [Rhodopirellula sp.]|nr:hypothetical protein [Rhodopirellula sp.]
MDWVALFCDVDDFCLEFEPQFRRRLLSGPTRSRDRDGRLSLSEMMTIVIAFQLSHYRDFKAFYHNLRESSSDLFPRLVSYQRFNGLMPRLIVPLAGYLKSRFGTCSGISFVDSTHLAVCGNKWIERNRVFEGFATRGKSTVGWFYGFKLHVVINDCGELLGVQLTPVPVRFSWAAAISSDHEFITLVSQLKSFFKVRLQFRKAWNLSRFPAGMVFRWWLGVTGSGCRVLSFLQRFDSGRHDGESFACHESIQTGEEHPWPGIAVGVFRVFRGSV